MIIYKYNKKKILTNTGKKIKAVLMDNFNYIDIPLMINICRSAKPTAVSAYKLKW